MTWPDLQNCFRAIPDAYEHLHADGTHLMNDREDAGVWFVKGGPMGASRRYEIAARLAGELLNPGTRNGLTTWLNALRRRRVNLRSNTGEEVDKDGTTRKIVLSLITNLCRTSADFCCELELETIQAMRVNRENLITREAIEADAAIEVQNVPQYVTEEIGRTVVDSPVKERRRHAINAYIEEVYRRKKKRITRTDIWRAAHYKTRADFERWERGDKRATITAHERFTRILSEKPHLK